MIGMIRSDAGRAQREARGCISPDGLGKSRASVVPKRLQLASNTDVLGSNSPGCLCWICFPLCGIDELTRYRDRLVLGSTLGRSEAEPGRGRELGQ